MAQLHIYMAQFPLLFCSPLPVPLCLPFVSPITYLAPSSCDRNCPLRSQVACKLTPFTRPSPNPPLPSKFPEPYPPSASLRRPREYSSSCYPEQVAQSPICSPWHTEVAQSPVCSPWHTGVAQSPICSPWHTGVAQSPICSSWHTGVGLQRDCNPSVVSWS
jgi:hypothetical protein